MGTGRLTEGRRHAFAFERPSAEVGLLSRVRARTQAGLLSRVRIRTQLASRKP